MNLPELPPMPQPQPGHQAATPAPAAQAPPRQSAVATTSRRMRQAVAYVGGASLGFVMLIGTGELVLRNDLKPTTLLATFEAQTDLGIFNQKLGAKPGETLVTEDQYRMKLAEAERTGQAKAELVFQRQMAAVQADKERVVGAYQTLYQRANLIAQAGVQVEAQAIQFRQRLIEMTNGGRAAVISVLDGLCAFGDLSSCEKARQARQGMMEESTTLTQGDMARKVRELMAGVEDPASFTVRDDTARNGTPALP